MMKHEFEAIAGYEVSDKTYNEIIEPMYMAVNLNKADFVKLIDKKAVALPTKAEMKRAMRKIAAVMFDGCGVRTFHEEEAEIDKIAKEYARRFYGIEWATDTKSYVYFLRGYGCRGVELNVNRGCTFYKELVIGRDGFDYERITLIG